MAIMSNTHESAFRADVATLVQITDGLDRLDDEVEQARATIGARQRGYFTPDEDDRVRQMLLAYRNYRIAVYDIINRYRDYEDRESLPERLRAFIVAYAAALMIYAKSQKIIQAYRKDGLVRAKLNEPDVEFGLPSGFFDAILAKYTSFHSYATLVQAERFWRRYRRDVRRLSLMNEPGINRLCDRIRLLRSTVHQTVQHAVGDGVVHRFSVLRDLIARPVDRARYGLQAFTLNTVSNLEAPVAPPCFDAEALQQLHARLRPGDVLLTRTERNLTSALLPGFWIHTVVYLGRPDDLERLGIADRPAVRERWGDLLRGTRYGCVVHAISPHVVIWPLETCVDVDHVAILRPRVCDADRADAIVESLRHVGKPYNWEFDFNQTKRIVCTGVVYRTYHGRGPIAFSLRKHLGRFALTVDELCAQALSTGPSGAPLFDVAGLILQAADGRPHVIPDDRALDHLRALRAGTTPSRDLHM